MLFFTQLCLTPKPGILSLYDEPPLCPSVYLDTSLTFPNQMDEVKEGAFQLLLSKTYQIDIYMGGSWVGIVDDNKKM